MRAAVVLLLAAALGAVLAALTLRGGDDERPRTIADARCALLPSDGARECYTREFLTFVGRSDDPRAAVASIAGSVRRRGGTLLADCHGIMHTVGRTYARESGVTLATLKDVLPRSNDPACPAGFAHGVVSGVAPQLDTRRPRDAADVCADAATRYQRYSCVHGLGHAFMRVFDERLAPALDLCRALDAEAPDCAQGAYHDYWFAVAGLDDVSIAEAAVRDPWRLCGAQPAEFVRPCWYRAFVENRSAALQIASADDLGELCAGLRALQRSGCITAGSVIGPADPREQLRVCAGLNASDAASCVRGTKVQNLSPASTDDYLDLIRGCEAITRAARAACYRWLGKTIAVLTNGAFTVACEQLGPNARHCRDGARSMGDALVTFS